MNKTAIYSSLLWTVLNPCNPMFAAMAPLHPCEAPQSLSAAQSGTFKLDRHGFPIIDKMEIDTPPISKNYKQLYLALSGKEDTRKPTSDSRSIHNIIAIYSDRETWVKNFTPRKDLKDRDANSFLCRGGYIKFNSDENCYEIEEETGADIKFKNLTPTICLTESPSKNKLHIPFDSTTARPTENCFLLDRRTDKYQPDGDYTGGLYFVTEKLMGISRNPITGNSCVYRAKEIIPLNKGYAITYESEDDSIKSFIVTIPKEQFSGLIELDPTTHKPTHPLYIQIEQNSTLYLLTFE